MVLLLFITLALFLHHSTQREIFVSLQGSDQGAGTIEDPWDMYSAVRGKAGQIKPGDTIWIRGGPEHSPVVYPGRYVSKLTGNSSHPIIFRNYNNERVIINGYGQEGYYPMYVNRRYAWFWGIEMMLSHYGDRWEDNGPSCVLEETVPLPSGGIKFINCVFHDSGSCGIMSGYLGYGTEVYGNIIFYNGYDASDRGHGHALYIQNEVNGDLKRLNDNIIFKQFSNGIQTYSESSHGPNAYIDNIEAEGNILFDSSAVARKQTGYNIIWGSTQYIGNNNKINNNYGYHSKKYTHNSIGIGYSPGMNNLEVRNNYFVGGTIFRGTFTNEVVEDNTFVGSTDNFDSSTYPDNEFYSRETPPSENVIFVRKNKYDEGRAHIAIYNWERLNYVNVDVTNVLTMGDCYMVKDVQDLFGYPVSYGTFNGDSISIQMTTTTITPIQGYVMVDHTHTDIEFGAFLLTKTCYVDTRIINGIILGVGITSTISIFLIFIGVIVALAIIIPMFLKKKDSYK